MPPKRNPGNQVVRTTFTLLSAISIALTIGYIITSSQEKHSSSSSSIEPTPSQIDVPTLWNNFFNFLRDLGVNTNSFQVNVVEGNQVVLTSKGNITNHQSVMSFPIGLQFNGATMQEAFIKKVQVALALVSPADAGKDYIGDEESQMFGTFISLVNERRLGVQSPWFPWITTLSNETEYFFDPPRECLHPRALTVLNETKKQYTRFRNTALLVEPFHENILRFAFVATISGYVEINKVPTLLPLISNVDVIPYHTFPAIRPGAYVPSSDENPGSIDIIANSDLSEGSAITFRFAKMDPTWILITRGVSEDSFPQHPLWIAWDEDDFMKSVGCFTNASANVAERSGRFHEDVFRCAQLQVLEPKHSRHTYDYDVDHVQQGAFDFLLNHAELALSSISDQCMTYPEIHKHNTILRNFFSSFQREVESKRKRLADTIKLVEKMKNVKEGEQFVEEIKDGKLFV